MLSETPHTFVGATTFSVKGMTCRHHQRTVTERITAGDGVATVAIDVAGGTVTVDRPVDRADIAAAVNGAGYPVLS